MTQSMTAFARAEADGISWEIRSVNHRYLDTTLKMPDATRQLETELRNLLKQSLNRGKVDCLLRIDTGAMATGFAVNEAQLRALRHAVDEASQILGAGAPLNVLEVLRFPGVLDASDSDPQDQLPRIKALFEHALMQLNSMRSREGEELDAIIREKLAQVKSLTDAVRQEAPLINARQQARLREKLADLKMDVDEGRLKQELVHLAQKSDIAEELDRLDTHVEEVAATLDQPGPIGRRLDFLMQELNREANTLSSKAVAANTSIQAVELKVTIEQMREQIQNIE